MKFRLRTYDQAPPGGYPFEQFEGIYRKFASVPLIEDQAKAVAAFRAGNHLPRASVAEALQDVDSYTCQRLGNNPGFCIPCDQAAAGGVQPVALNASSPIISPCGGCGAPVT